MNRRTVTTSLIFAIPAFLAACQSGTTPAPSQTQLQTYAALTAPVLDIVVPALLQKPRISASDVQAISLAAADIRTAAEAIAASSGSGPVNAQTLVGGIRSLAPVAIRLLAKDAYEAGLMQAAVDLMPVILSAAGVPAVMAGPDDAARQARAVAMLRGARR